MRFLSFSFLLLLMLSCKKYHDPKPFTDDRLNTRKYCNDPAAINFNWDFPGYPDNNVCIYPSQIYSGDYLFYDTITDFLGNYKRNDSFDLHFSNLDSVHLNISGFCGAKIFTARANRFLKFHLDTLFGYGQVFCNTQDTIALNGSKKDIADTNSINIQYQIYTDTGIVYHYGTAIKK